MPKVKIAKTPAEKRVVTIVRKHGITAFRRWGKQAWTPRPRRSRRRGRIVY